MLAFMPRHIALLLHSVLAILLVSFGNAAEQEPLQVDVNAAPKRVAVIGMQILT